MKMDIETSCYCRGHGCFTCGRHQVERERAGRRRNIQTADTRGRAKKPRPVTLENKKTDGWRIRVGVSSDEEKYRDELLLREFHMWKTPSRERESRKTLNIQTADIRGRAKKPRPVHLKNKKTEYTLHRELLVEEETLLVPDILLARKRASQ